MVRHPSVFPVPSELREICRFQVNIQYLIYLDPMESPISRPIIFSYLSGQATPIEIQRVDEWLKDPANFDTFCACLLEWERAHEQFTPDHEKAIERFRQRLENPEAKGVAPVLLSPGPRKNRRRRLADGLLSVAACLLLLAAGAWFLKDGIRYKTIRTPYGEISRHTLPDGSIVTLNANSSLRLPRFGFSKEIREVWLDGEAEFSVVHTQTDQRFVVKTARDFQVEVLGTEFSVFTRDRGKKVVLNSGKIRVDYKKQGQPVRLTMKPGDLLTLNHAGEVQLKTTSKPLEHSAWKERRFVFDATPVSEICQLLRENFGVVVRPSTPEIAGRTISGNFETETSEELLDILREVFALETRKQQDTLVLYQK